MYHTQEKWDNDLNEPIICRRDDAWLGEGFYFWYELQDAQIWGQKSKTGTGMYQVYKADIDNEDVLDTVFNQEHYHFWLKQIEKVIKVLGPKTGRRLRIKDINDYFQEKGKWKGMTGIMFQDIPTSETSSLISGFYYRKRIQLVVYNKKIIHNFALHLEERCN